MATAVSEEVARALEVMYGVWLDGRRLRFDSIAAKEARAAEEEAKAKEAGERGELVEETKEEEVVKEEETKEEEKTADEPSSSSSSSSSSAAAAAPEAAKPSAAALRRQQRDPPFHPLSEAVLDVETGFVGKSLALLGLTHINSDWLMHRSGTSEAVVRNVSLVSPSLSDFVQGSSSKQGRPPLVLFAGVHFLTRRDAKSTTLRPCQDGVHWYSVLGAKNTVSFTADDMILMLRTAAKSSNIIMPYDQLSATAQASLSEQPGGHVIMRGPIPRDPLGRSVSLLGINNDNSQSVLLQASASYVASLKSLFDIGEMAGDDIFTITEVDLFQVKRHKTEAEGEGEGEGGEEKKVEEVVEMKEE